MAFPAVLASAAPAMTFRVERGCPRKTCHSHRHSTAAPPDRTTVIRPNNTPIAPEVSSTSNLIPAPMAKAANGMISFSPGPRKALAVGLVLPRIKPRIIGKMAAKSASAGKAASPAAPRAIMVRNGPSLIESTEIAPLSLEFPNWLVRATNSEPFEFDIAAMIASGNIPHRVPSGMKKATESPTATAAPNFASSRTMPFSTAGSAARRSICEPTQTKNKPINTAVPLLNKAVVKLPISSACGATLATTAPRNSGTIINAPGIRPSCFSNVSIGILPPKFL